MQTFTKKCQEYNKKPGFSTMHPSIDPWRSEVHKPENILMFPETMHDLSFLFSVIIVLKLKLEIINDFFFFNSK